MRVEHELAGVEPGPERDQREAAIRAEVARFREQAKAPAASTSSAPSATRAAASTTSCAAAPAARATRAARSSTCPCKDDLMRIFGSDRMEGMLVKLGLKEDEAIVHPWINKALEKAQQKVEARNFDMRKNILKYDDVMNDQRKVVFEQRREMMASESLEEQVERHARRRGRRHRGALHPARRLSRGVGHRRTKPGGAVRLQRRPAPRRLAEGRGHLRRGDARAPAEGGRRGIWKRASPRTART